MHVFTMNAENPALDSGSSSTFWDPESDAATTYRPNSQLPGERVFHTLFLVRWENKALLCVVQAS